MAESLKLENADILEQVLAARRESYESRLVKDAWARKAWNYYNNLHDWSLKEEWQSRVAIPNFAMAIDQATNFMRQGLRRSQRLFGIEVLNDDPIDKFLAAFFGAVMHETVRQMNITRTFVDGMKVGLITNQVVHKVGFESDTRIELAPSLIEVDVEEEIDGVITGRRRDRRFSVQEVTNTVSLPTVKLVDPLRYYPDPRGHDLYEVQEAFQDLSWVIERFQGITPNKVLAELWESKEEGQYTGDERQDVDSRARAEIMEPSNSWRRIVKLTEYWGPVYTRDGKLVKKRARIVIANDKHILIHPEVYPFWDGESPFTKYQGISVPFSVWGKLLIQHSYDLQLYSNELMAMMLDKAKLSALSETAVDVTLLDDVEDILTGIFPGKTWKTRGQNAIQEVKRTGIGTDNFNMMGLLNQQLQNSHGMTEFLQGSPTTRGRATATEVEEKMSQGAEFFNGILSEANDGMEKVFEKVYNRIMQFKDDWSDPAIQKIADRFGMTPYLSKLTPVERYNLMKRPFRFHSAGLNAAIKRSEMLKNLTDLMSVMGNFGPAAAQMLPLDKMMSKIIEAFDLSELLAQPSANPNVIVPGPVEDTSQFPVPQVEAGALQEGVQSRMRGAQAPQTTQPA